MNFLTDFKRKNFMVYRLVYLFPFFLLSQLLSPKYLYPYNDSTKVFFLFCFTKSLLVSKKYFLVIATPNSGCQPWLRNLKPLKFYEARSSYLKDCDCVDGEEYVLLQAYAIFQSGQLLTRTVIILIQFCYGTTYYPSF